eukprot:COSAG01_NODE_16272_length_1252_cov_3.013877_2_plen_138_part_00
MRAHTHTWHAHDTNGSERARVGERCAAGGSDRILLGYRCKFITMPTSGYTLMASRRFDSGLKEKFQRGSVAELRKLGEKVLVVEAGGGETFGGQTMQCLDWWADNAVPRLVAGGVRDMYGQKTKILFYTCSTRRESI